MKTSQLILLIMIGIFMGLTATLIAIGIGFSIPLPNKPETRHQPTIILDTEEEINAGDTLYVIYKGNDTLFLYGK